VTPNESFDAGSRVGEDRAPGESGPSPSLSREVLGNVLGLLLAASLTAASFWVARTHAIYGPGIAMALLVLAVAQMGIHLVFFLHITTSPDNTNAILALAFGVLIVALVVFGSLWVMSHLAHSMPTPGQLMQMQ
jgi:cytochrome o ubiquinol oxidase operon protein cyoD